MDINKIFKDLSFKRKSKKNQSTNEIIASREVNKFDLSKLFAFKNKKAITPSKILSLENILKKKPKSDFDSLNALTKEDFTRVSQGDFEDDKVSHIKVDDFDQNYNTSDSLMSENIIRKERVVPLIGKLPINTQYQIMIALFIVSALALIGGMYVISGAKERKSELVQTTTQLVGDLQRFDNYFNGATQGKEKSFNNMNSKWTDANKQYEKIKLLNNEMIGAEGDQARQIHASIATLWSGININVNKVQEQGAFLRNSAANISKFNEDINQIFKLVEKLSTTNTQSNEVVNIFNLKLSLQSIQNDVTTILLSETIPPNLMDNLKKSRNDFHLTLKGMYQAEDRNTSAVSSGNNTSTYFELAQKWVKFGDKVDELIRRSPEIIIVRQLTPKTSSSVEIIDKNLQNLLNIYESDNFAGIRNGKFVAGVAGLVAVLSLLVIIYIYLVERENKNLQEKVENNKNQSSILRLLNEMMPLSAGDLTKKTTVTEEITGAIADSINSAIDSLAGLVKKIKDTSFLMREKTSEVNVISLEMLKTNEDQAKNITNTGTAVIQISKAIEEISDKTQISAKAAEKSVQVSQDGVNSVMASVESMKAINNNMNDTVKLMEKVGDSSKQISEIVELLSDITEETSVLASNATVQAAKAGEAGKGFKIVADSIQELADKASDAARRVGALISAVQTDIQAVGQAVKKTTNEVEYGVSLSEKAGRSLNEISTVSFELSKIVSLISEEAKSYASTSKEISENMTKILQRTEEHKQSTQKTATSIGEIAGLSNSLGESVQSFTVE